MDPGLQHTGWGLVESAGSRLRHLGDGVISTDAAMPLAEVIVAFDGPIALTACVDGAVDACESEGHCPVRGRWDPVNDAIRQALSGITVADLATETACAPLRMAATLNSLMAE